MGNFTEIQHPKKRAVLSAFAKCGRLNAAFEAAKMDVTNHYKWSKNDPEYVAAFAEAELMAADMLEGEAVRRAVEGVQEPVFYQGQECGRIQRYSDTLLIFLLKGDKPEKFAERRDITSGGSPLRLTIAGNADSI